MDPIAAGGSTSQKVDPVSSTSEASAQAIEKSATDQSDITKSAFHAVAQSAETLNKIIGDYVKEVAKQQGGGGK